MDENAGGNALLLRGVSHRFGRFEALTGVDLEVGAGDIYGFLGLNGAGKTTAIRIVLGLLRLRAGDVRVLGASIRGRPPAPFREVGVLFEDFAAHAYLTGEEHVRLHARLLGVGRAEARRAAGRWLERVGLGGKEDIRVRGYSLGMRRRLGIACALVGSPRLVILDEPTNGLDPRGISDLRELILELNRSDGVTFFLSSHILGEVEQLCSRVGIIHQGRMLAQGSVRDITGRARSRRRVRAAPEAGALEVLRAAPWCRGVEREEGGQGGGPTGAGSGPPAGQALLVDVDPADVPRMVRALVERGVEVHEVSESAESLEAVFHRTVRRAMEGGPVGAAPAAGAA
jgi:ABC-2 type transport system ATP-binding protein